jgi:hypothetical protein
MFSIFENNFCAPPSPSAAVGEPQRWSAKRMRTFFALISVAGALLAGLSGCSDGTAQVGGTIDGKQFQLSARMQQKLAEEAVSLLKSCTYANLNPTNEYASVVAHAQERPHLNFIFSKPRVVDLSVRRREVPSGKLHLELREMVITLPLSSGAFLVRSNQETFYFAKFNCPLSKKMEQTLKKALK